MYHYHLGLAYTKNGEPDRARRALETALTLNPTLTGARQALASLQDEQGLR
jgi:Tfp pilus assembly protein PilF